MRSKIIGGGKPDNRYIHKMLTIQPTNRIGLWPLWEPSGTVMEDLSGAGRDGAYTSVTLGQPGIGDGRTSATFDGTNSFGNIYSVSFRDAFDGDEGWAWIWGQVNSWTDGAARILYRFEVDGSNIVTIYKNSVNNQMICHYEAGNTIKSVTQTVTTTGFFGVGISWSAAANQMKGFYADLIAGTFAQIGSTQTGLGTWAGTLSATQTVIGAATTTPTVPWSGQAVYAIVGGGAPLSNAEAEYLATL